METVLITGGNRGIGLALTELFLKRDYKVIATARDLKNASALNDLTKQYSAEKLQLETVDVSREDSVTDFWGRLQNTECIDILINNAGILSQYGAGLKSLNTDVIEETFNVNTLGPVRVTRGAIEKLLRSNKPKIVNVSSRVGSVADNSSGYGYAYRMSKTALNMFNKNLAIEFPGIISVVVHPGWVQTDMGGEAAPISPIESAAGLLVNIESLNLKDSGNFLDFRGQIIPW